MLEDFSIKRLQRAHSSTGEIDMDQEVINDESGRERECIHRQRGAEGEFYRGDRYILALQRLRNDAAMKMASKVGAFFWSDAPHVKVWLCQDCAMEIKLHKQA
jgi:hypothetical protein